MQVQAVARDTIDGIGAHIVLGIVQWCTENVRDGDDVLEQSAGAAGNQCLVRIERAVMHMLHDAERFAMLPLDLISFSFDFMKHFFHMLFEFPDRHRMARMEWQCNHRLDRIHIDLDAAVIVRTGFGFELLIICRTTMLGEIGLRLLVGAPDGAECCRFGCHHVDAHTVLHREIPDTRTEKLEYVVLIKSVCEGLRNQCESHIHRSDARLRASGEAHADDLRIGEVIGMADQLLHELAATFTDTHRAEGSVTGMRI